MVSSRRVGGASTLLLSGLLFCVVVVVVPRPRHGQFKMNARAFKFSVDKWECLMIGTSNLSPEPILNG